MRFVRPALVVGVAALALLGGCAPTGADPGAAPQATASQASPAEPEPSASSDVGSPTASTEPSASPSAEPTPEAEPSTGSSDGEQSGVEGNDGKAPDKDRKPDKPEKSEPEMLAYGATGERVVTLQTRLQELGYFLLEVDGSYGPATQQAVWALQKSAGLYRDGVVGPDTQRALDQGVRPSAVSSSGKVLEIDIDRQLVLAVEDGVVQRIMNASSGNEQPYEAKGRTYQAHTSRGTFSVYMERNYAHESTLELGTMYRPKYFNGGIAVHGSPSIPPYPASHGCVRVSNSAINWLWDSWGLPIGTTVIVH
jgi:lipoprotein-anchoring transpeptidase ErfK/SrfK